MHGRCMDDGTRNLRRLSEPIQCQRKTTPESGCLHFHDNNQTWGEEETDEEVETEEAEKIEE